MRHKSQSSPVTVAVNLVAVSSFLLFMFMV